MANKNRIRITYPSSEKIYIPGKIHKIKCGYAKDQNTGYRHTR